MNTDQLLQKIGEMFTSQTTQLHKEIKDSEERVKKELRGEITKSQEETIEILTEVINESHVMLDKRLKRVEDHLDLPPLRQ